MKIIVDKAVIEQALEALEDYVDEYGPHDKESGAAYAITALRQAIEQEEQAQPEKEVTITCSCGDEFYVPLDELIRQLQEEDKRQEFPNRFDTHPSPPPRPAAVGEDKLKPLTDEQIAELFADSLKAGEGHSVTDWARRIEAAHGITKETT